MFVPCRGVVYRSRFENAYTHNSYQTLTKGKVTELKQLTAAAGKRTGNATT